METEKEEVVCVEFWPLVTRSLKPYEIVTVHVEPSRGGRPRYQQYRWYDCAFMGDGTLIFDLSGVGGLVNNQVHVTRGPYWATRGLRVMEHGERKVRRLPQRLLIWPPMDGNAIEARIVECAMCGWVADDGWCESPCEHLAWNYADEEWVNATPAAGDKG